jgi:hypothetical protein
VQARPSMMGISRSMRMRERSIRGPEVVPWEWQSFQRVVLERKSRASPPWFWGGVSRDGKVRRGEKTYRDVNSTPRTPKLLAENFLIY